DRRLHPVRQEARRDLPEGGRREPGAACKTESQVRPDLPVKLWVAIAALWLGTAQAQPYPAKALRFIIPFPPGGPTDIVGRLAAERLSRGWNVQVLADNRPGSGGNIGTEQCARAPADGYTLCMISIAQSISPAIYPKLGFD